MWSWQSMSPGNTVMPATSMISASAGHSLWFRVVIASMWSPRITIVAPGTGAEPVPSISRAFFRTLIAILPKPWLGTVGLAEPPRFCDRIAQREGPVSDHITSGRSALYRAASESLHRDRGPERQEAAYRMLWACGLGDLIRRDFYGLFEFTDGVRGDLLDAGCGSGIEAVNLQRLVPGLRISGIDVSSVALSAAVARPDRGSALFYQASLERLPFGDGVFDY